MKLINKLDQLQVKKYSLISFLGIGVCFLLYYYFSQDVIFSESNFTFFEVSLVVVCGILISNTSYFISIKMDDLIPWKLKLTNRFLAGISIQFITVITILVSMFFIYAKLVNSSGDILYQNALIKLTIIVFILALIYQIVYFALYSYYSFAILQIEATTYERKQINLQLNALKSQLSPHFLFNNLNTISALAFKDQNSSEIYLRGLSKVYQYSLKSYQTKLVFLEEEINMLKSYLLLLKTRHGDFFSYKINIENKILTKKVPPLTLQMLVENVVKHNVIDAKNRLHIDIFANSDSIIVKNNITKTPNNVNSFSIGLKNIESRYHLLIKKGITVSKGIDFIVEIPLIS